MNPPQLAVIPLTEAFENAWGGMASASGALITRGLVPQELDDLTPFAGILISSGGDEERAFSILDRLASSDRPEIVVAGTDSDHRLAIRLLQSGAADYFCLPKDLSLCRSWMAEQVSRWNSTLSSKRFAAEERVHFDFSKLIGKSPLLKLALRQTSRIIPRDNATILVTGETGTGKELLAKAIHFNGPRATQPFVDINCTTLPDNLLEAELFGYEQGAFTDARAAKPGLFEMANGGTLFLDEIGDLSLPLQAKLLRVLEDKTVRRLGGTRSVQLNLRIIAATHVDLPAAVHSGRFRQDLYYRLNVFPIRLPPLRERGDDVIDLAEHFLTRYREEYALGPPGLPTDVKRALRNHDWPGNIRELRNSVERAVLLGDGNLFVEDFFPNDMLASEPAVIPFPASMQTIERSAAAAMIARCGGNKSEAAKALGISRKHLYTLIAPLRETKS